MKRYEYVPAALDSLAKGSMIGVKFNKRDLSKTHTHDTTYKVERHGPTTVIKMVDREVHFLKNSDDYTTRLNSFDYDVLVDSDLFMNKGLLSELGYNYAMVNTHAVPLKYHHLDYAHERSKSKVPWPEVIADSGGFQIRTGVHGFLSPEETVKIQNKVCSVGIALDIPFPVTHKDEVSLFRRAALVQRANNEVYKKHKSKGLEIMNVIHGPNFHLLDRYREVIEDESIDRVSIGGVRKLELTPLIFRLLNVILKGKKYKHYHALGVSGIERWVLLCYIAQQNIAELITSDSTTYMKNGFNMQYFEPNRLCYTRDIRSNLPKVEQYRRLTCSCPICSTIGYSAPVIDRAVTDGSRAVTLHNTFVSRDYLAEIYEVASLPCKELLAYLKPRMSTAKLQTVQVSLAAVDMALQESLDKAAAKFSPYLLQKDPTTATKQAGLFHGINKVDKATIALRERVDLVLKQFEEHHGMESK